MAKFKPLPHLIKLIQDTSAYKDKYHEFVLQFDMHHYEERVEMAGFIDKELILDAGCGIGQWSAALARYNKKVIGVDRKEGTVESAKIVNKRLGINNIEFYVQDLTKLEFPDNHFDLIWCWSVLQFVNRYEVLKELNRVLKTSGRLLVGCCNSRGRWLEKAIMFLNPFDFKWKHFKSCWNVLQKGHDIKARKNYTTMKAAEKISKDFGFKQIEIDFDGHIDVTGKGRKKPMFSERFLFFEKNIEFIWEKVGASSC
jgi:ubiquinone/menaquinone biosynthesis C-methylase UbiE